MVLITYIRRDLVSVFDSVRRSSFAEILIILAISIVLTFSILRTNNLVMFHDSPYPLNPQRLTYEFGFVWRDVENLGHLDITGIALVPFYWFISVLDSILQNNVIVQGFFLFIILLTSQLSMLFLARYIGLSPFYSLFACLLYIINPYALFYVWRIINVNVFLYAVFPLIFKETLQIFESVEATNRYLSEHYLHLLLFISLAFPAFTNLAWLAAIFLFELLLFLIVIVQIVVKSRRLNKRLLVTFGFLLVVSLLPFWWYILGIIKFSTSSVLVAYSGYQEVYRFNTEHVGVLQLFSITGMPPLYENIQWYTFQYIYTNSVSVSFVALTVSLFFVYGILKNRNQFLKLLPFYLLPLILFPILSNFGHVFEQMGWITLFFRDPYHKLGFIFSVCVVLIFANSVEKVFAKLRKNRIRSGLILLALCLSSIWVYPFFVDPLPQPQFTDEGKTVAYPSPRTSVLSIYSPVISYLLQDLDIREYRSRVLVVPPENVLWYEPELYFGNDVLRFSGIPTISTLSGVNSQKEIKLIQSLSDKNVMNSSYFPDILNRFSIKYVLVRKKAIPIQESILDILNSLANRKDLVEIMNTEWFTLYRVDSVFFSKIVSIPYNAYDSIGNKTLKLDLTSTELSTPKYLNWTLRVLPEQIELYPMENATKYTWIDISPKINAFDKFTEIRVVFQENPEANTSVSLRFDDGLTVGPIVPTISAEGNTYLASFELPMLIVKSVGNVKGILLSLGMDKLHHFVITEFSFREQSFSIVNLLKYDMLPYAKINPTKYVVQLNVTSKLLLAFSESYDPSWTCYANNEKVSSFPLYGVVNGFWINQTGRLDIIIEYEPQNWFYIGCAISITTFLACTAYLAYSYTKTKPILQKLKQKLAKTPHKNT